MKAKYILTGIVGFILIIAWNVFLIHRDTELFKQNYHPNYQQNAVH